MAQFQQLQADRLLDLEAAKAVQTTEAATRGQAPQSNAGQVIGGIGSVASSMVKYKAADRAAEAEKLLKGINEKKLQTMFDGIGLKLNAGLFSADYTKGVEYYVKYIEQEQKNIAKSAQAANDAGFYKAIAEHSGHEALDAYDTVTSTDVNGNEVTRLVKTGEKAKPLSQQEIIRDVSKKFTMPAGFKPELYFGVQEGLTKTLEQIKKETAEVKLQGDRLGLTMALDLDKELREGNMPLDVSKHSALNSTLLSKQAEYEAINEKAVPIMEITTQLAEGTSKTGVLDIALIFKFMNALDPSSVVREGEFALAADAGGYVDGIGGLLDKVLIGQMLPEEGMKEMVTFMAAVHNGKRKLNLEAKNRYKNLLNQTYYGGKGADKVSNLIGSSFASTEKIDVEKVKAGIDTQDRFNSSEAKDAMVAEFERQTEKLLSLAPQWWRDENPEYFKKKKKKTTASATDEAIDNVLDLDLQKETK